VAGREVGHGLQEGDDGRQLRGAGRAWGRFVFFADPDGNRWAVQQITLPS
jgi:hypothetical protein